MQILVKFGALGAAVVFWATAAIAAPLTVKPDEAFREAFPQVPADSIKPTDIKGLFEVVSGTRILYYFQEKNYLFVGDIYQKGLKNLTAEKRAELEKKHAQAALEAAKKLPLEKAVKIGNGKKVIIEFTDPECPFCRNASAYLAKRTDVTRYVFFIVLADHPLAMAKIHYILGADDKAQAYEDMMAGKDLPKSAPVATEAVKGWAREDAALGEKVGIPATPTFFLNNQMVVGANIRQIEQLLKD